MTQDSLERFEGTAPKELLAQFDAAWRKRLYKNRSDVLCSLMRDFIRRGF
jgi:metal-responsive CopG/Arc/MetJ family transcriptional regulator